MRRQGLGCGCIYAGMALVNAVIFLLLIISLIVGAVTTDDNTTEATGTFSTIVSVLFALVILADTGLLLFAGAPMLRDGMKERALMKTDVGDRDEEDEEGDEGHEDEVDNAEESDEGKEIAEG